MQLARDHARREVADRLYEVLMQRPGPTRASVLFRSLPPTIGVELARETLAGDPRFITDDSTVDLAVRAAIRGANFQAALQRVAGDYGHPIEVSHLAALLASTGERTADYYLELIGRLAQQRDVLCQVGSKAVPIEWLLFPEGDNDDDVLWYADLDGNTELATLRTVCEDGGLRGASPADTAAAIVAAAGETISNRVLGFFVNRLHRAEFDPVALLGAMLADARVYAGPELVWSPGRVRAEVDAEVETLRAAHAGHAAAAVVDLGPILAEPLPPDHPGYYIEDDALEEVYDILNSSPHAISVAEVLRDVLNLSPEDGKFTAAAHSVWSLLLNDPGVIAEDHNTITGAGAAPAWARAVPEALVPVHSHHPGDVLLRDEGLQPGLADKVHDPYLEDVGEQRFKVTEDIITVDETFYTLPVHHFSAGTMKLRQMDARLFRMRAPVIPFVAVDPDGKKHQAWANTDLGLLLGLRGMYDALGLGPGSLLQISAGEVPGEWLFEPIGEDEETSLSPERRRQLLETAELLGPDAGLYELVRAVIGDHPDGVSFERLNAEVNAIRRTTRLQLASILSYYKCFAPGDDEGDLWLFSAQDVPAGPIADKRRFVITK